MSGTRHPRGDLFHPVPFSPLKRGAIVVVRCRHVLSTERKGRRFPRSYASVWEEEVSGPLYFGLETMVYGNS